MEFTQSNISNLRDSGKDICIYSKVFSKLLYRYNRTTFNKYSSRLYYLWRENVRPIPIGVVIQIMKSESIQKINVDSFSVYGGNKTKITNENSSSFYYIIGLILGDGCLVRTKKGSKRSSYLIQISFRKKKDAIQAKKIMQKLFGLTPSIYDSKGCYNVCLYSKVAVLILHEKYQIPIGLKYSSLQVPTIMQNAKNTNVRAFLKGVFDSDGNIYIHRGKKSVQLRQKSPVFITQLKELFTSINLNFRDPYYDKANNSWVLWSSKKELVDNFINIIVKFNIKGP